MTIEITERELRMLRHAIFDAIQYKEDMIETGTPRQAEIAQNRLKEYDELDNKFYKIWRNCEVK